MNDGHFKYGTGDWTQNVDDSDQQNFQCDRIFEVVWFNGGGDVSDKRQWWWWHHIKFDEQSICENLNDDELTTVVKFVIGESGSRNFI